MSKEKNKELFRQKVMDEINNSNSLTFLKIQKKELTKEEFHEDLIDEAEDIYGLEEEDITDILEEVDKICWGFGIIDDLINDPSISDIRLIDENHVRIKRNGKREATDIKFASKEEYARYIEFITYRNSTALSLANAGQVFTDNTSCPTDILRFTLVSDYINTSSRATLLIRKIPKKKKTFEKLISQNYCTKEQAEWLKQKWIEGHGILVCGPNGSGKTTLTNALLDSTPHNKSAVVTQESEELFCDDHPEMVFRKVISNGNIVYDLKALSKLALMESFDIFIIGEIKGDEAADLSYATYTGSQAMTTVHSNSAIEAYEKIIDYALATAPNRTREHFAKQLISLDIAVYVKDYHISEISMITSYNPDGTYNFKKIEI